MDARHATRMAVDDDRSDEEIVREVRAGAFAEFEVLVRRHARRVHRAVRSVLRGDEEDVEDAAQQAYLQAFVALRAFAGDASFATWLTRIAVNEARMRLRRARLERRGGGPGELALVAAPYEGGPERAAASREALALVQRAVHALPPRHRDAFRLRHVDGLSVTETAARLGVSPDAVKVRLHRARRVLRLALADGGRRPGRVRLPEEAGRGAEPSTGEGVG